MATKSLFLLRHAKAINGGVLIPDQDRPLSDSGVKDAKRLGSYLSKKSFDFDLILSSPAIRAITTAQIVANKLGYKQCDQKKLPNVYKSLPKIISLEK